MFGLLIVFGFMLILFMAVICTLWDKVDKLQAEVNKQNHVISQRYFDRRI